MVCGGQGACEGAGALLLKVGVRGETSAIWRPQVVQCSAASERRVSCEPPRAKAGLGRAKVKVKAKAKAKARAKAKAKVKAKAKAKVKARAKAPQAAAAPNPCARPAPLSRLV